jgi:hypothetical protein
MAKTRVDDFLDILNKGRCGSFSKRLSVQMTCNQLDTLLSKLESEVDIPETVPRAIAVIGKQTNPGAKNKPPIWVLNKDVAINQEGEIVNPVDYGFVWISHLVEDHRNLQVRIHCLLSW